MTFALVLVSFELACLNSPGLNQLTYFIHSKLDCPKSLPNYSVTQPDLFRTQRTAKVTASARKIVGIVFCYYPGLFMSITDSVVNEW